MKNITLFILALSLSISLTAQENERQKEIGISLASIEDFGFTFKTGTDKALWRFNTLFVSGVNSNEIAESHTSNYKAFSFGIAFGKEYRKEITTNLELRVGADLRFSFHSSSSVFNYTSPDEEDIKSDYKAYIPGIRLVAGLNYVINTNFVIGAEILPSISYPNHIHSGINSSLGNLESHEINYEILSNSVLLTVAYRF